MVMYYIFLYSGMAKFVSDLQSERDFMVIAVDLLHTFHDENLSNRAEYLDEMKTIANDLVQPLFEKDVKSLKHYFDINRDTSSTLLMPVLPTASGGILFFQYYLQMK